MLLEELIFGLSRGVKPSRSWTGAGRHGHTAVSAVRAKGAIVLAKGQNSTLGIQTHPLHLGFLIFFLFTFHLLQHSNSVTLCPMLYAL